MVADQDGLGELSDSQYRSLVAQTSDVITIVDETGTIRYQSPNSEHVKGWPPEELLGQNILDLIHPEDRDRVTERFMELMGEVGVIDEEVEFRFRTKDDDWIWLATTGTAPGPESEIDGYVTTSRDITPRKQFEQQLTEQRDGLEILNGVIRHDIRNEIQLIEGHAEILEPHVEGEATKHLETILNSADDVVELTRTTRDLTEVMLESDRSTEPVSLAATLSEQLDAVRSTYPDAEVTVDGSLPTVFVLADELLESVFRNLLKNAIQHNRKDEPRVTVSAAVDDDEAVVRVADNGPGIPDGQKEEIFGRGEKGLESAGAGVGLYLVRSLVEGYGGRVWVEDNDPDGSVFIVKLLLAN